MDNDFIGEQYGNFERKGTISMISKIIHYCWFGKGEKPTIFKKCIQSWKFFMPDWEIIEWNEENTNLSCCTFVEEAYKCGKWAFVSDFVRLKAVYEYGGIYMDTDVELYESLEDLLDNNVFMFFQNHHQINTGLGFGAEKGNDLIKSLLDDYMSIEFSLDNINNLACPVRNTEVIRREVPGFIANNTTQCVKGINFISFDDYCRRAHHYGEFSWKTEDQLYALKYSKKNHKAWKLRKRLRNPKIFQFLENHRLNKISRFYGFLVYDCIDYGVVYWIMRIVSKLKKDK